MRRKVGLSFVVLTKILLHADSGRTLWRAQRMSALANAFWDWDRGNASCFSIHRSDVKYSAALLFNPDYPSNATGIEIRMSGTSLTCQYVPTCEIVTAVSAMDIGNVRGGCYPFCGLAKRCTSIKNTEPAENPDCIFKCDCGDSCGRIVTVISSPFLDAFQNFTICGWSSRFY